MTNIPLVLALSVLSLFVATTQTHCRPLMYSVVVHVGDPTPATRAEIISAVDAFVKEHSVAGSDVDITTLDVRGTWALAGISPRNKGTDDATVLLRKRHGAWKALVLGTALYGTGREYGVPKQLRKKWGL